MARHQVSRISWLADMMILMMKSMIILNQLCKFSKVRCKIRHPGFSIATRLPILVPQWRHTEVFWEIRIYQIFWLNFEPMTTDDIPGCKYIFSKLLEPNAGSPLPDRTRYNMTGNTMTSMMTTTMEKMRSMTSINCVTQLKLYTVDKLSSSIFCCLSVRHRWHLTKNRLFPIYKAYKPFADPVPPNIKQYQLYTGQVPASIVIYWPNTIKYHL